MSKKSHNLANAKWRAEHPDYFHEYFQDHKRILQKRNAQWAALHPEATREHKRRWRLKNRNKINELARNYAKGKGRLHNIANAHRRRAAGHLTAKMIEKVFARNIQKYGRLTCVYCERSLRKRIATLDHVRPVVKGGKNTFSNLTVACAHCNSAKHALDKKEFLKRLAA